MYAKVTYGDAMGGDFLCEVYSPIHSGSMAIPFDPEDSDHNPGLKLAKAVGREMLPRTQEGDYQAMPFNTCHVLAITEDKRTEYERNTGQLVVKFVWWDEPGDGLHAIVTTRNIFITGENGKTIDRV